MTTCGILALAALLLTASPLRHARADDCKCDPKDAGCIILCSPIGSVKGTGGGSSTFEIAPKKLDPLKQVIVAPPTDAKGITQPTK